MVQSVPCYDLISCGNLVLFYMLIVILIIMLYTAALLLDTLSRELFTYIKASIDPNFHPCLRGRIT